MENAQNILNAKVGNREMPKGTVKPAKVKIVSVVVKTKDKNDKQMTTPLLQFMVKHPSKEELLNISKIKYLDGDKLVAQSFWAKKDENENFFKGSSVDKLLSVLKVSSLAETYGLEIDTVEEGKDSQYLCLKAY
jgi:hypothetical protein